MSDYDHIKCCCAFAPECSVHTQPPQTDEEYIHELEGLCLHLADWSGYINSGCSDEYRIKWLKEIRKKRNG